MILRWESESEHAHVFGRTSQFRYDGRRNRHCYDSSKFSAKALVFRKASNNMSATESKAHSMKNRQESDSNKSKHLHACEMSDDSP